MSWEDRIEVQKGDLGELLVDEYIKSKGVVPYKPDADQAHPFDRLCASRDKKTLYIAEVKSKAKRKYYPDTGIDIRSYNGYKEIQEKYKINVFMYFVDDEMGLIYGGPLNRISKKHTILHNNKHLEYPITMKDIIYFPLKLMKQVAQINKENISKLTSLTTKNTKYL